MKQNNLNSKPIQTIEFRTRSYIQSPINSSRIVAISANKITQSEYYKSIISTLDYTDFNQKKLMTPLQRVKLLQSKMKYRPKTARQRDQHLIIKAFTLDINSNINQQLIKKQMFGTRQKVQQNNVNNEPILNILKAKYNKKDLNVQSERKGYALNLKQKRQRKIQTMVNSLIYGQKQRLKHQHDNIKIHRVENNPNRTDVKKKISIKNQILCPQFPDYNKYWRDQKINLLLQSPKHHNDSVQKVQVRKRRVITSNLIKRKHHIQNQQDIKPWQSKNVEQSLQSPL